ncbi:hypothetical protein, partial [Paenibacillus xylanexedens]|uniref:hypothetical protein n=1 Tax=Paenibacillus xylanexedens TaxID=528191 RepID=UPI0011A6C5CF
MVGKVEEWGGWVRGNDVDGLLELEGGMRRFAGKDVGCMRDGMDGNEGLLWVGKVRIEEKSG